MRGSAATKGALVASIRAAIEAEPGEWTVSGLADDLGVDERTVYKRLTLVPHHGRGRLWPGTARSDAELLEIAKRTGEFEDGCRARARRRAMPRVGTLVGAIYGLCLVQPRRTGDLARALHCSPQAVQQAARTAVKHGWLVRSRASGWHVGRRG